MRAYHIYLHSSDTKPKSDVPANKPEKRSLEYEKFPLQDKNNKKMS